MNMTMPITKSIVAAAAAALALISAPSLASDGPPSPFAKKQDAAPAPVEALKPIKPEVDPEAESPKASASGVADDKAAQIKALEAQLNALKAAQTGSQPMKAAEPKKSAVRYESGMIMRALPVTTSSYGENYNFGEDAISAGILRETSANMTDILNLFKTKARDLPAFSGTGFFKAESPGRYSFLPQIEIQKNFQRGVAVRPCFIEVKIQDQPVAATKGLIGIDSMGNQLKVLQAVGGIRLDKGVYKFEWNSYCPTPPESHKDTIFSIRIQTPNDMEPVEPKAGSLFFKAASRSDDKSKPDGNLKD